MKYVQILRDQHGNETKMVSEKKCNTPIPIDYFEKLDAGCKRFLKNKKIFWLHAFASLTKEDILSFEKKFQKQIFEVWNMVVKKCHLFEKDLEVLTLLHHQNIRISPSQTELVHTICAFRPLFGRNLKKLVNELFPQQLYEMGEEKFLKPRHHASQRTALRILISKRA